MKPATRTRWNGEAASFAGIGGSTGTSYSSPPQAAANAAATSAAARLLLFRLDGAVIDFLEQIVVLADVRVVRIERERLFVGLPRFVELPFVLVRNRQIVERGGVFRVEFDGFLPAVNRFAPQAALRAVDAELSLLARIGSRVGGHRRGRHPNGGAARHDGGEGLACAGRA